MVFRRVIYFRCNAMAPFGNRRDLKNEINVVDLAKFSKDELKAKFIEWGALPSGKQQTVI